MCAHLAHVYGIYYPSAPRLTDTLTNVLGHPTIPSIDVQAVSLRRNWRRWLSGLQVNIGGKITPTLLECPPPAGYIPAAPMAVVLVGATGRTTTHKQVDFVDLREYLRTVRAGTGATHSRQSDLAPSMQGKLDHPLLRKKRADFDMCPTGFVAHTGFEGARLASTPTTHRGTSKARPKSP